MLWLSSESGSGPQDNFFHAVDRTGFENIRRNGLTTPYGDNNINVLDYYAELFVLVSIIPHRSAIQPVQVDRCRIELQAIYRYVIRKRASSGGK